MDVSGCGSHCAPLQGLLPPMAPERSASVWKLLLVLLVVQLRPPEGQYPSNQTNRVVSHCLEVQFKITDVLYPQEVFFTSLNTTANSEG